MSDTYQAVYDAVRSRIGGADIGGAIESVMRGENIGHYFQQACYELQNSAVEHGRPCVVFKPTLTQDGNAWLAVLGDLPTGVVGCGDSPAQAMADFDAAWYKSAAAETKELGQ